jgi:hypothetical protein
VSGKTCRIAFRVVCPKRKLIPKPGAQNSRSAENKASVSRSDKEPAFARLKLVVTGIFALPYLEHRRRDAAKCDFDPKLRVGRPACPAPKIISRGGDSATIFPSGQPLVITVPMNDTGLFASHSTNGGGFQPEAIEHAAPSLAGMAISNAHIANAALFLFTDFPPCARSAAPVLPRTRRVCCSVPIYDCACPRSWAAIGGNEKIRHLLALGAALGKAE